MGLDEQRHPQALDVPVVAVIAGRERCVVHRRDGPRAFGLLLSKDAAQPPDLFSVADLGRVEDDHPHRSDALDVPRRLSTQLTKDRVLFVTLDVVVAEDGDKVCALGHAAERVEHGSFGEVCVAVLVDDVTEKQQGVIRHAHLLGLQPDSPGGRHRVRVARSGVAGDRDADLWLVGRCRRRLGGRRGGRSRCGLDRRRCRTGRLRRRGIVGARPECVGAGRESTGQEHHGDDDRDQPATANLPGVPVLIHCRSVPTAVEDECRRR